MAKKPDVRSLRAPAVLASLRARPNYFEPGFSLNVRTKYYGAIIVSVVCSLKGISYLGQLRIGFSKTHGVQK